MTESNISSWIKEEEGQLAIDVYETTEALIVKSTIAGVDPEDLDISLNHDMLTIRGRRENKHEAEELNYLFRECYWGSFSRTIILPVDIIETEIDANIENGVLTITLPKAPERSHQIKVRLQD